MELNNSNLFYVDGNNFNLPNIRFNFQADNNNNFSLNIDKHLNHRNLHENNFNNDIFNKKNDNVNTRPKRKVTENNKKKKDLTDNEILRLLDYEHNLGTSEDSEDNDDIECNNPLCNHKAYSKEELKSCKNMEQELIEVKNIYDLIKLGKMYHCKRNKSYKGINLRLLCNMVPALTELDGLVGMHNVKQSIINQIVFFLQGFNEKSRCGKCLDCVYGLTCIQNANQDMLHTVITGPPGVGKTELGKILGKIYKALGILARGHFNIATRSDLIGKYLGHTAAKTQEFINKCRGGVMFIDEAYSLGNPEGRDSFSKECIDVINQNLSERRDFLCIIAGYKDQLDKCFFAYNPGLNRRFPFRYDITGYSPDELLEIFTIKVQKEDWCTEYDINNMDNNETINMKNNLKEKVKYFFANNKRSFPHYGGDVETLFLNCKIIHGKRVLFKDPSVRKVITLYDIEKGFEMYVKNKQGKDKSHLTFYS